MEELDYKVGDSLVFLRMNAIIRYIGTYHEKPGTWIGIEVDVPKGKNNGTIQGVKYFECKPNHGFFLSTETFLKALKQNAHKSEKKPEQAQTDGSKLKPSRSKTDLTVEPGHHRRKISMSSSVMMDLKLAAMEDDQENSNSTSLESDKMAHTQNDAQNNNKNESEVPKLQISQKNDGVPKLQIPQKNKPETPAQKQETATKAPTSARAEKPKKDESALRVVKSARAGAPNTANRNDITSSPIASNQNSNIKTSEVSKEQKSDTTSIQEENLKYHYPLNSTPETQQSQNGQDETSDYLQNAPSSPLVGESSEQAKKKAESLIQHLKAKCQTEYQKIKNDAVKYKKVQAKIKEEEEKFNNKMTVLNNNFQTKLAQLQLQYLPEQIQLEETLFQSTQDEKEAKRKSMEKNNHMSIEMLQAINEEHIKFENSFRELIIKQSNKITNKKNKINLLENKLKNQYEAATEQINTLKEIQESITSYENELKEKQPVSQESSSLRIKIAKDQDILNLYENKFNNASSDCKVSNELLSKITPYFGNNSSAVVATNLVLRLREKAKAALTFATENSEIASLEDILHICEVSLFVFNNISFNPVQNNVPNPPQFGNEFQLFIDELTDFENSLDNDIIKAIDSLHIMHLLQSITPIPLNLAISSHLIKSVAYHAEKASASSKDELKDFSRQIPRLLHPNQLLKNREDCEKFSLSLRSELRNAEKSQQFSLVKFTRPLQTLLANQTKEDFQPKFKLIAPQEIANLEAEAAAIAEAEKDLPDLRRKVADLEATYDQFSRYNIALSKLKSEIPQKIEDIKAEIDASEAILQEIENERKAKKISTSESFD